MMGLESAKKLIREFEGLRLSSYICPAGKLTIGYGHTKNVLSGQSITKETAEILLEQDCQEALSDLKNTLVYFRALSENEVNALVSFVFNLGISKVKKSTLFKILNSPAIFSVANKDVAGNEFLKWVYSGKQKLPGLIKRREAEKKLFLGQS